MQIQFVHAPVHTPEQVRAIIDESATIAAETAEGEAERLVVFAQACTLLGARASLALPPQPIDLAALALPNGAGR